MRAMQFLSPGKLRGLAIDEPEIGADDILIEMRYLGLCGTDLSIFRGVMPLVSYPRIPGHEIGGEIIGVGKKVAGRFGIGDRVMVSPYAHCGGCLPCRIGRFNCCEFNETMGVQRDGAMRERIAVHQSKVFASKTLTFQELALVEPLSVGYHAANRGRVSEVDTTLVIGCGTIGLGVIAAASRKGGTVIGVDVDDTKRSMARKFGAAHTVNSAHESVIERIRELTAGEGASVVIEAVGRPETFRLAIDAVAFGGRVVYIGYAKKETTYDTSQFVKKELDILGSRNAHNVFPVVLSMLEKKEFPFPDLVTEVFPFDETQQAFEYWNEAPGKVTKILIDMRTV